MNYALLFFGLFVFGCSAAQSSEDIFEKDFAQVSNVYKKNITPYFLKLAENEFEPVPKDASDSVFIVRGNLIKSRLKFFEMIFQSAMVDSYSAMSENLSLTYQTKDRYRVINSVTAILQNQLLGVDYSYYKKCRAEIEKLSK